MWDSLVENAPLISGQILLGLINGAFYALMSLGLSLIFGLLNIVNFLHASQYMLGAFLTWFLWQQLGLSFFPSMLVVPVLVGLISMGVERLFLRRLNGLDPINALLMTFGMNLIIESLLKHLYGVSGLSYPMPEIFAGGVELGFMYLPLYRVWVLVISFFVCLLTYLLIEKTALGRRLRAARENPAFLEALGVSVQPLLVGTYVFGGALAAFAGVLAAPLYSVRPNMGSDLIILVFAVVVVGGMGSLMGSIVAGFALGFIEGITRVFWPEMSTLSIFLAMALVLIVRPRGLFGVEEKLG